MGKRRAATPLPSEPRETLHGTVADSEVDLHGLRAHQARVRVDLVLDRWVRRQPGAVLRFITGRGRHSEGAPVLLDAVGDLLRGELGGRVAEMVLDAGGGGWLVRVGRTTGPSPRPSPGAR